MKSMQSVGQLVTKLLVPISKFDTESRTVTGIATQEVLDSQNDVVDYDSVKSAMATYRGNIREMHQPKAVGKALSVDFDDSSRAVGLTAYISKGAEDTWQKVLDGTLKMFSIGAIGDRLLQKDAQGREFGKVLVKVLNEISLVDSGACPTATFTINKLNDHGEVVDMQPPDTPDAPDAPDVPDVTPDVAPPPPIFDPTVLDAALTKALGPLADQLGQLANQIAKLSTAGPCANCGKVGDQCKCNDGRDPMRSRSKGEDQLSVPALPESVPVPGSPSPAPADSAGADPTVVPDSMAKDRPDAGSVTPVIPALDVPVPGSKSDKLAAVAGPDLITKLQSSLDSALSTVEQHRALVAKLEDRIAKLESQPMPGGPVTTAVAIPAAKQSAGPTGPADALTPEVEIAALTKLASDPSISEQERTRIAERILKIQYQVGIGASAYFQRR